MANKFVGPSWKSSHVYGHSFFNHAKKLFYVNTPKCASSWMKHYLDLIGLNNGEIWLESNFTSEPIDDYQPIIIVRDPVKRWLSICPGLDRMREPEFIKELPRVFDRLKEWQLDEHSALQADFIQGLDLSNAVFFYCDNNLSNNVQDFLKSKGVDLIDPPGPQNEQPNSELYQLGVSTWNSLFADQKNLNKFKQAYKRDYDLISQIKFYDPR